MRKPSRNALLVLIAALTAVLLLPSTVQAGTTGAIGGRVYDSASLAPLAGAKVSVVAPSQQATTTTDSTGAFLFVSLAPDTYLITADLKGYDTTARRGVTVLANQVQNVTISMNKSVTTLAKVNVRASIELVKPGTTSDLYSVNASGQAAAEALAGSGNLNQAYAAMASVPGTNVPQAQMGWYQPVYIRGGDLDQVGWELDGIPVNRSYDNAPETMVSSLGQQELQVYTGGTLSTADASGISGYLNQVIKKGTFPGFSTLELGIGGPALYNKFAFETSGATPDQNFSYYLATSAADTRYRYINQNNGAGEPGYFYPLNVFGGGGTNFGTPPWDNSSFAVASFSPGQSYAMDQTRDRETVLNFHFGLPHRDGSGQKDDIQALYYVEDLWAYYNSSINDQGGAAVECTFAPVTPTCLDYFGLVTPFIPWQDGTVYTGPMFGPVDPSAWAVYLFPSSPPHGVGTPSDACFPQCSALGPDVRDVNENGIGLYKLQYQKNFSDKSYFRIFGYGLYSDWYIHGPLSNFLPFGAELADYENIIHTGGGAAQYVDQIAPQHLLTISAYFSSSHSYRDTGTGGFPGCTVDCSGSTNQASYMSNLIDSAGNCYDSGGFISSCFSRFDRGRLPPVFDPTPFTATGLALTNGAQWFATSDGYHKNLNNVRPKQYAVAVNDYWKPTDKLSLNVGLRVETYRVDFPDLTAGYPARAFWFTEFNNEFCFGPGLVLPERKAVPMSNTTPIAMLPCPAGTTPVNLMNPPGGGSFTHSVWQPRLGLTYEINPDDVLRFSGGIYARPASTREASWNTQEQNLPYLLGSDFLQYGLNTPFHDVRPDRSTNFDFSWEHHFKGSDWSFKLTPFYRSTQDQLQQLIVNALTGLFASFNAGRQRSYGVEFALNKGDFSRDGFSLKFAYTYTHSRVRYGNFANGRNVIDNINAYIQQYNGYTSACAGNVSLLCTANGIAPSTAVACFTPAISPDSAFNETGWGSPDPSCASGDIPNPYFGAGPQPLLDRNGEYTTYDLVPIPFAGANGYETPNVASLILNYKRDRWSITPSFTYSSGSKYGSPLSWPGVQPDTCSGVLASTPTFPDPTTCNSYVSNPSLKAGFLMIPDVYTGKFDNLGDFKQPSRFTMNMAIGYQMSEKTKATLTVANIIDTCHQRGYPWENAHICAYSSLPSSFLPPVGNFATPLPLSAAPAQIRFPYAVWLNNNNTGFVGTTMPLQFSLEVSFKLR